VDDVHGATGYRPPIMRRVVACADSAGIRLGPAVLACLGVGPTLAAHASVAATTAGRWVAACRRPPQSDRRCL